MHPRLLGSLTVAAALATLSGCATFGWTSSVPRLLKQVSFDHSACPAEEIQLLRAMEGGLGRASFVLDVCGEERRYERMGSSYFQSGSAPPAVQRLLDAKADRGAATAQDTPQGPVTPPR